MSGSLHPNLARLAASYDQLVTACNRGEIEPAAAIARMSELTARDDNGVLWRLSAATGTWQRATIAGAWVADTPPAWGLATPTAHDLTPESARRAQLPAGDPSVTDPGEFISHTPVDLSKVGGSGIAGSTLRAIGTSSPTPAEADSPSGVNWRPVLLAGAAAVVGVLVIVRVLAG